MHRSLPPTPPEDDFGAPVDTLSPSKKMTQKRLRRLLENVAGPKHRRNLNYVVTGRQQAAPSSSLGVASCGASCS